MKGRPIGSLVEGLRKLGADIRYLEKENFPPLQFYKSTIAGNEINIDASISSQFISALLLVAPYLKNGLRINLKSKQVSRPYIDMTCKLMKDLGIELINRTNSIEVSPGVYKSSIIEVEADWSSAAFFYEALLFSDLSEIHVDGLKKNSIQGDKACVKFFKDFGLNTIFKDKGIKIEKVMHHKSELDFDLTECPDLIPSIVVSAVVYGKTCKIKGTSTLKLKESDRVLALKTELAKIGTEVRIIDQNNIVVYPQEVNIKVLEINSYNDHRIAMALAPLKFLIDQVKIDHPEVVSKSLPEYWIELEKLGISCS